MEGRITCDVLASGIRPRDESHHVLPDGSPEISPGNVPLHSELLPGRVLGRAQNLGADLLCAAGHHFLDLPGTSEETTAICSGDVRRASGYQHSR